MKTVFLVMTNTYKYHNGAAYDMSIQTIGVFTTREQAEKVAESYNSPCVDGYCIEIELNKEYQDL